MNRAITARLADEASAEKRTPSCDSLSKYIASHNVEVFDRLYAGINLDLARWNLIMDAISDACVQGLYWCRVSTNLFDPDTQRVLRYIAFYVDYEKSHDTFHIFWGDHNTPHGFKD